MNQRRTAVILFNLGGPDRLDAVEPFLFNLFFDRAIIDLPLPLRWLLAWRISTTRAPLTRSIYMKIGGKSPLVEETEAQAKALEAKLGSGYRVFVAMRYWHPMTEETIGQVVNWRADDIVLLPLYPHFSKTSTGSSLKRWHELSGKAGIAVPTRQVCCYPDHPGWIEAVADLTGRAIAKLGNRGLVPRVLFSAHGLPKRVVERGDPYQAQIELSVAAVVAELGLDPGNWSICYQSRVGRLPWIGPSIDAELARAATDKRAVVVVPISFVSEHSETLVELDMDYRDRAEEMGLPAYERVPAVGCHPAFIDALAGLVTGGGESVACGKLGRACPARSGQ